MSVRQASELDHAFQRCGLTAHDVKLLSTGRHLELVRWWLRGTAEIVIRSEADRVSLADYTSLPAGLGAPMPVLSHEQSPRLRGETIMLKEILSEVILIEPRTHDLSLEDICKTAGDEWPLDARILELLLDRPFLIPEAWKKFFVFFPGTFFGPDNGRKFVRGLRFEQEWKDEVLSYTENCVNKRMRVAILPH